MDFVINKTWDGEVVKTGNIYISLKSTEDNFLQVDIRSPFFNDPCSPPSAKGQPFLGLWNYEGDQLH